MRCRNLIALLMPLLAQSAGHNFHGYRHQPIHDLSPRNATLSNETEGNGKGIRSVAYFVNWAIYLRSHQPQDLPVDRLTHVLYAFANVKPDSGEVYLTDLWSDVEKHYPTDRWGDVGTNAYGNVKQLYMQKKANRNLKVLLSIGGASYSANFALPASTGTGRKTFAQTAMKIIEDVGFDGIDINWEYPQNEAEARDWVLLLAETRAALDDAAKKRQDKCRFLLTVACPAGPQNFQKLKVSEMDRYLDFWNLMAYDYAGGWDPNTGHQANLFVSQSDPTSTPFSTDAAVRFYTSNGVHSSKLVMGMPLYGRTFENTAGPGSSYQGIGEGSWEQGIWDSKVLPKVGCAEQFDAQVGASWCYDSVSKTMITYDTAKMMSTKAQYVMENQLGGGMWWETSADRRVGNGSLIEAFITSSGGKGALMLEQNCIDYPESIYDNIRMGLAGK